MSRKRMRENPYLDTEWKSRCRHSPSRGRGGTCKPASRVRFLLSSTNSIWCCAFRYHRAWTDGQLIKWGHHSQMAWKVSVLPAKTSLWLAFWKENKQSFPRSWAKAIFLRSDQTESGCQGQMPNHHLRAARATDSSLGGWEASVTLYFPPRLILQAPSPKHKSET